MTWKQKRDAEMYRRVIVTLDTIEAARFAALLELLDLRLAQIRRIYQ